MPQHITIERRLKREITELSENATGLVNRNLDIVHAQGGGELSWRDRDLKAQYEALQVRLKALRAQLDEHRALAPKGIAYARYGVGTKDEDFTPRKARKSQPCQGPNPYRPSSSQITGRPADCTQTIEPGDVYVEVRVEAFQGGTGHCLACVREGQQHGHFNAITLGLDPKEAYGEGWSW